MSENTLSTKQARAIAALLSERTHAAAAESAGISERTLYSWLADATFQQHYQQARREAVLHATAQVQALCGDAIDTLQRLLMSSSPSVALGAAKTVLDLSVKAIELDDLAQRIERLEQAHAQKS